MTQIQRKSPRAAWGPTGRRTLHTGHWATRGWPGDGSAASLAKNKKLGKTGIRPNQHWHWSLWPTDGHGLTRFVLVEGEAYWEASGRRPILEEARPTSQDPEGERQ